MYKVEERPTMQYWRKEFKGWGKRPEWEFVASYPDKRDAENAMTTARQHPKNRGYEYRVVEDK